jgi:hypothetical protein
LNKNVIKSQRAVSAFYFNQIPPEKLQQYFNKRHKPGAILQQNIICLQQPSPSNN